MSIGESMLPEYDQEMANARKVIQCVPDGKLDWKAHPKLNSIGWVMSHLVEIPGWVEGTLTQESWDVRPPGGEPYRTAMMATAAQALATFDAHVAAGRTALAAVTDHALFQPWSLLDAGQPIFTMPRLAVIRSFVLNHLIHHRAFLVVYLRMNDIEVPGMYGP